MEKNLTKASTPFKLTLPLKILYLHAGNEKDYPLRVVCTPCSQFATSSKDCDTLLPNINAIVSGTTKGFEIMRDTTTGTLYRVVNSVINLKYTPHTHLQHENNAGHLSHSASLSFNICCSIRNEYGRPCWRNGGMCYVSLLELLGNSIYGGSNHIFTFRKIYNSGFNVSSKDKLTGILGVALGELTYKEYLGSIFFGNPQKWALLGCFPTAVSVNTSSCAFLAGCHPSPTSLGVSELPLAVERDPLVMWEILFGIRPVTCDNRISDQHQQGFLPAYQKMFGLKLGTNKQQGFLLELTLLQRQQKTGKLLVSQHSSFNEEVKLATREYEDMLKRQGRLVILDDQRTKNMKCPWCPMDTCIWENFSDYSETYIKLQRDNLLPSAITVETNALISPKFNQHYCRPSTSQQPPVASVTSATLNETYLSKHTSKLELIVAPNVMKLGCCNQVPQDSIPSVSVEKRIYLPFFAYLLAHPLRVFKGYWNRALVIHCDRKGLSYEEYLSKDWRTFIPARKVSEAFQMILSYVQAIEYISDYYYPRKDKKFSLRTFMGFESEAARESEETTTNDDGRIEIEQFWNCLRSLCGDCDDLTLGNAQFYRAFVVDSWDTPKVNQAIRSCPILTEMRQLLANNYVIFANIEAVYLPRQSAVCEDENIAEDSEEESNSSSKSAGQKKSCEYFEDTQGINSAHAALKLLPKLYFERCVNRSCVKGMSKIFLPSSPTAKSTNACCFYHAHPPDTFNDDLPVLFGEGTSMLVCSDDLKDECTHSEVKKAIFEDSMLDDVTKSTIYAKKGTSSFYKASLFGATLDFLKNHKVSTFSYARLASDPNRQGGYFLRGASHKQLSFKDENVVLVPYGHELTSSSSSQCRSNFLVDRGFGCTSSVKFKSPEMSEFLYHLCLSESKKRVKARKIRDPTKPRYSSCNIHARKVLAEGGDEEEEEGRYSMIPSDTGKSLSEARVFIEVWLSQLNRLYGINRQGVTTQKWVKQTGAPFILFVDNFYVNQELLGRLSSRIFEAYRLVAQKHEPHLVALQTSCALEQHSEDLQIWRLTFTFYDSS